MQNIWETDEERKRKMQMMGAPLQGIQYQQQQQQPQNIQAQRGPDDVGTTAQKILVARGLNKGIDYGVKKAGEGIDYGIDQATQAYYKSQAPLATQSQYDIQDMENNSGSTAPYQEIATVPDAQYEAQGLQEGYTSAPLAAVSAAPTDSAASTFAENIPLEDMTSGMMTDAATSAATEGATTAATEAVAQKGAEAVAEGAAGSVGGPLSAGLTLAKTGDAGKAAGAGAGTYIGATLGSAFGPIGTFVGSAIGSYVGQYAGGYLT